MLTELLGGARLDAALALAAGVTCALVLLARRRGAVSKLFAAGAVLGLAVAAYAHWLEPRWRRTAVVPVPWHGPAMRVAFLSDLHAQPGEDGRMRSIAEETLALRPDLILLGGDFLEGNDADPRKLAALEPLRALEAPLGVLAVLGNHDAEEDVGDPHRRAAIVRRLRELGLRLLVNERVRLANGVVVVGLGDWRAEETDASRAFAAQRPDAPTIVLMHNHQSLRSPWTGRFDLALAGHTHGGQGCVPGTSLCPFADADMKPFLHGLFDWPSGGKLYVTSGLGTSGVRARIGARPEIALVTLTR